MNTFNTCFHCTYNRGFHIALEKKESHISLLLICPECGSSYDLSIIEESIKAIVPQKKEIYSEFKDKK